MGQPVPMVNFYKIFRNLHCSYLKFIYNIDYVFKTAMQGPNLLRKLNNLGHRRKILGMVCRNLVGSIYSFKHGCMALGCNHCATVYEIHANNFQLYVSCDNFNLIYSEFSYSVFYLWTVLTVLMLKTSSALFDLLLF